MAIGRPKAIDDAPVFTGLREAGRLSCLARNGRLPRGRKSDGPLASRRSRRSRSLARLSQERQCGFACQTASLGEFMAIVQRDKQGHRRAGRRKRSAGAEKESVAIARRTQAGRPAVSFQSPRGGAALDERRRDDGMRAITHPNRRRSALVKTDGDFVI
jgi:hypothetical protein